MRNDDSAIFITIEIRMMYSPVMWRSSFLDRKRMTPMTANTMKMMFSQLRILSLFIYLSFRRLSNFWKITSLRSMVLRRNLADTG